MTAVGVVPEASCALTGRGAIAVSNLGATATESTRPLSSSIPRHDHDSYRSLFVQLKPEPDEVGTVPVMSPGVAVSGQEDEQWWLVPHGTGTAAVGPTFYM